MRHSVFGRNLSRDKGEKRRLFMMLARDIIARGSITTTLAKARAVAPVVEKLITLAKKGKEVHRRLAYKVLADKDAVKILFDDAKTRFSARTSGYTRIVRLGAQKGDNTEKVMISFVDASVSVVPVAKAPGAVKDKKQAVPSKSKERKTVKKADK